MNCFCGKELSISQGISCALSADDIPKTVLLTSTCWWPLAARLALRFADLGWRVEALCHEQHPLHKTQAVRRFHSYHALRPLQALSDAFVLAQPGLIVPCDDRALDHVLSVQEKAPLSPIGKLAESCLAPVSSHACLRRRGDLIRVAQEAGLRAPDMRAVIGTKDLREAAADFGFPLVLKSDLSWGGMGVIIAHTPREADQSRRVLLRRAGFADALQSLLLKRDPYRLLPAISRKAPQIYAQRFVRGRPANVAAVGWKGECLASVQVEALLTSNALGASTVVQTIDRPDIAHAAETIIQRLNISGFCGLDFMIEDNTGDAHLIELNPRATPTSHLALGDGRDLVRALDMRLRNLPRLARGSGEDAIVALFPDALHQAPDSIYLETGQHDVPWQAPELVRELARIPYSDRGALARLIRLCRPPRKTRQSRSIF